MKERLYEFHKGLLLFKVTHQPQPHEFKTETGRSILMYNQIFTGIIHNQFCKQFRCVLRFHFLPPTILWPEVPVKPEDALLLALPNTFRSSNNLYEGTKGFCAAGGAGLLALAAATRDSPLTANPFSLAEKEL